MFGVKMLSGFAVILIALLIVIVVTTEPVLPQKQKIIIDTDAGTDDAMALFLLIQAEKYLKLENNQRIPEIVAVTTVNGNTYLPNVCINVLKVLKLSDRLDIPVYKGAHGSLLDTPEIDDYFGQDGMGDIDFPLETPSISLLQKQHAVHALVELATKYPGEIELIALGPLTNIAMAVRIDKDFINKLKKLVILGGSTEGKGNKSPGVEFNFYMDPEANYIVLNGDDYRNDTVHLLSWENIERVDVLMSWRKEVLGSIDSTIVKFMNDAEHLHLNNDEKWVFADPIAAIYTLHPEIVQDVHTLGAIAITQGITRGGLALDHYSTTKNLNKVNLLKGIDSEKYKQLLDKYFQSTAAI